MTTSSAFQLLHPQVQKWIWRQNWGELREIQERTIRAVFETENDIVLSAPTAGGKTEAAFLPILSVLLDSPRPLRGFEVLALSPLKALINDQYMRLEGLGEVTGIPVHPWHGDVSASKKERARKGPKGILLITPESLEAMFVLRGNEIASLFSNLKFILVDELHAFIASERGVQLQSLLHRVESRIGRPVRRIGLSATLGDMDLAKAALRPSGSQKVEDVFVDGEGAELRLQIRGYSSSSKQKMETSQNFVEDDTDQLEPDHSDEDIAAHLFRSLRGQTNLVFAGSRSNVEVYADRLRRQSEDERVPNEFLPHHGNLSKEIRHDVEQKLKSGTHPFTAVCTTTLELGIDIGDVESVAHIGAPTSIASLKQKLGRSGRRLGKPAILRIYNREADLDAKTPLLDRLRLNTVLSVAAVELLLSGWCEPPRKRSLHLSTFLHQILSVIASRGGILAPDLFYLLCKSGSFHNIDKSMFVTLLRQMADKESGLIEQAGDGTLMLADMGERLVEHYSFYAVFQTPEEYRVETAGKTLGTIPIDMPLVQNATIIFAGRRWTLLEIRDAEKLLIVKPGTTGTPAKFSGSGGMIHDELARKMLELLHDRRDYPYLDQLAKKHFEEGREAFASARLNETNAVVSGEDIYLFPWVGTDNLVTLQLGLVASGIDASVEGMVSIRCRTSKDRLMAALTELSHGPSFCAEDLADVAGNKLRNKFDMYLGGDLLIADFAAEQIFVDELPDIAKRCLVDRD